MIETVEFEPKVFGAEAPWGFRYSVVADRWRLSMSVSNLPPGTTL